MRKVSSKRARLNRQVKPLRDEYREEFPCCQWCGEPATQLHEISRGAGRGSSLGVRASWLHLCQSCHDEMNSLPIAGQLAIKRLSDIEGYDRRVVNELRGRTPDAVTETQVDKWVQRFVGSGTR